MKLTNTVSVARDPTDVFAFLSESDNIPRWNDAISHTRKLSDGPVGLGSRYVQKSTVPTHHEETFEVTEFAPDQKLTIAGTLGLFIARLTYLLVPIDGATFVTNTVELEATGLFRLVAPRAATGVQAATAEDLRTLKRLLE